jgi:serine phosphatase RsbU (regulator of sigma subunit)/tetratricopeptide (TPR) repeat protein
MKQFQTIFLFLYISLSFSYGQVKLSDIKIQADTTTDPALKTDLLLNLGLYYESKDFKLADNYYNQAINYSKEQQIDSLITFSYLTYSDFFRYEYDLIKALQFNDSAEFYCLRQNDTTQLANIYKKKGAIYRLISLYPEALSSFQKSLALVEITKDSSAIADAYLNIGAIHGILENNDLAFKNYKKAYFIDSTLNNPIGLGYDLNNLGIYYFQKENYDSAMICYTKAMELFFWNKSDQGIEGLSMTYTNMSNVYAMNGKYNPAIEYGLKALEISRQLNDLNGMVTDYSNISGLYSELMFYRNAEMYADSSLELAKKYNIIDGVSAAHYNHYMNYKEMGKLDDAIHHLEQHFILEDSINNSYNMKQIALLTAVHNNAEINKNYLQEVNARLKAEKETEETKQRLLEEETALRVKDAELKKDEELETLYIVIISILIAFIGIGIYLSIRNKRNIKELKTQKSLIKEKNEELFQQNEEIRSQRDLVVSQKEEVIKKTEEMENIKSEIEFQRDNANKQTEIIAVQQEEMQDSIRYAKRIQAAIFPDRTQLDEYFKEYFILFKPRDIVSGDFFWFGKVENRVVFAVSDCTGHGVPGAFMSMLGITFLKEIVLKEYITHPGVILRRLRKEVVKALKQTDSADGTQKDGMDISVCSIDKEQMVAEWAGANHPLYIVTDNTFESKTLQNEINLEEEEVFVEGEPVITNDSNGLKLYSLKPDKMPISIYYKMDRYTTHEFKIHEYDRLYFHTDGYVDQKGGPKAKKFKPRAFRQMIIDNAHLPMKEQHSRYELTLSKWMSVPNFETGKLPDQFDDITFIGMKL